MKQRSPLDLAVILLNWRHEEQTLRCARAVTAWQALKPHLIVVDNESTEATSSVLSAALPANSLICSTVNLGYGGGNNLGIRRALAAEIKYVLLLNTDAEIGPENVSHLLERLETHPQISIVGPVVQEGQDPRARRLVGGRDIAHHSSTRIAVPRGDVKSLPDYPIHEVDYVSGTVFLARASVLKEIGLLDEEFFFSGEIADFCKRARNRGHKIYVDLEVEAQHHIDQTSMHLRETLYLYYGLRNRFLYVKKHYARQKIKYFSYWTMAGAVMLARALGHGKMAKARAVILALMHAHGGHYGNQNGSFI
jgi:GT2 family glycosyltransferase